MAAITLGLSSSETGTRAAAALCVRALTRSVRHLRGGPVDAELAGALCRLLGDSDSVVQARGVAGDQVVGLPARGFGGVGEVDTLLAGALRGVAGPLGPRVVVRAT
jgi:hypothetical protein